MCEYPFKYYGKDLNSRAPFYKRTELQPQLSRPNIMSWRNCHTDTVILASLLTNIYKLDEQAAVTNHKYILIAVALNLMTLEP